MQNAQITIQDYVKEKSSVTPTADIVERWEGRIVPNGWQSRGREGAISYIAKYGKGMKAPKAIMFARLAEVKGFPLMAMGFFEEAFFLETGVRARLDATDVAPVASGDAPPRVTIKQSYGQLPQLLQPIVRAELEGYILNPDYGLEEKFDGERALARNTSGLVQAGNKKGLIRVLPLNVNDALATLPPFEVDGEQVDDTYYVFDLLRVGEIDLRSFPYSIRHTKLTDILVGSLRGQHATAVKLVELVTGTAAKRAFVAELEKRGAEGVVIKRLNASYEPGESHNSQFKYQFRSTGACVVGKRNGEKNSVELFAHEASGGLRSIGFVTIPSNHPIPREGAIAEVECLYLHAGADGKLAQPVFKGVRADADDADCLVSKFRVKVA
jgi:ATP dependent DNA ligase domain